ncbi:hypothetical protein [Microbacterium cremeum]|uniref:hypothetical protein n=1 Tax=Microbacterium cremeum TaxID=2782169 RepID=UPI0018890BEB|nr:hypothetical protein [Microbacterium cremeum]
MSGAVIRWRIKDTLLAYMTRDRSFSVTATGGATFGAVEGIALPAVDVGEGTWRATGAVTLSAHGGALRVPLIGVRLTRDALWIEAPDGDAGDQMVRLVTVHAAPAGGFATALAPEADLLFLYNYVPGTPFGELSIESS